MSVIRGVSFISVFLLPFKFSLCIYNAVTTRMPEAQPWALFGLWVPSEAEKAAVAV